MAGSEGSGANELTIVREAFPRTIRLVSSARLRAPVMALLADNEDDLRALVEIEGATSGRLIAEDRGVGALTAAELVHGVPHAKFINASFAYAKPRQANRFSPAERGAWYAALETMTCIAEVGYHLTAALADAGDFNATVEYSELIASMAGTFIDLRAHPHHLSLNPNPDVGYPEGAAVAATARARGHNGIIYPSVRDPGGTCIVALWPNVVQSVIQGDLYQLTWLGTASFVVERL